MAPAKSSAKKLKVAQTPARAVGGYALLAIAVVLIAVAVFLPGDKLMATLQLILSPKHVVSKPVIEVQVEKDTKVYTAPDVEAQESSTPSAYDEYVAMSKEKGWSPADPVLKLESTIRKYSHVFDILDKKSLENSAVMKQYLDMMGQEVKHLLKVLCKSTDRAIDLTPSLHLALDSIQEVVYRLLKLYLGSNKMVYRSAITGNLNHWMYSPLQELTKVAAQKYPHLLINFNARSGGTAGDDKDNTSSLEKATKRGLYNLLPMLLVFGADADSVVEALHISIRHGDDIALALLLTSIVDPAASGTAGAPHLVQIRSALVQELPALIALAQELRFEHVLGRLLLAQKMVNAATPEEGAGLLSQLKGLERHNDYPASAFTASTCSIVNITPEDGMPAPHNADSPSGYHNFQIVDVFGTLPSPTGTAEGINRCIIDRVDMSNITVEQFYQRYVVRNQPVVLTSAVWDPANTAAAGSDSVSHGPAEGWDLQALLGKFGDIKEVAGAIPYATLFGHTEEVTTLKRFVDSVMRPHTARLAQQFASDASSATITTEDTDDDAARKVCKVDQASGEALSDGVSGYLVNEGYITGLEGAMPGYIFSGVQQNLNKAVRKQMVQSVLHFSEPSPPTSASKTSTTANPVTRLMDLMHSVSADFPGFPSKAAEPARRVKHKSNFKPHWKSQFYLGPPLSGAPFHHHGPAFNMLVYGRKEWTIMPPARDVYSSAHPVTWLQDGGLQAPYYPYSNQHGSGTNQQQHAGDQPCKIVQNPGEVIFVPRHWTHQVLNLAESVGFAVEIDDYVH